MGEHNSPTEKELQVEARFDLGKDIYVHQAMMLFGVDESNVTNLMRQSGKVQVLSFSFGGDATAAVSKAIDDPLAQQIVALKEPK